MLIHDDLLLYKHVYEQISASFKESIQQNKHLKELVDGLREENSRYINFFNDVKASGFKDQKNLIGDFNNNIQREKIGSDYGDFDKRVTPYSDKETNASLYNKQSKTTSNLEEIEEQGELESDNQDDDDYTYNLYSPIAVNFPEKIKGNNTMNQTIGLIPSLDLSKTNNDNYKLKKKEFIGKTLRLTKKVKEIKNDEWKVAIKHAGVSIDDIIDLSRNKLLSKVFEVMMNLNRIIQEKNAFLQDNINKLKHANEEKQKKEQENIELYKNLITLRKEVENLLNHNCNNKMKDGKYLNTESSMVNNINNQTISGFEDEESNIVCSDEDSQDNEIR